MRPTLLYALGSALLLLTLCGLYLQSRDTQDLVVVALLQGVLYLAAVYCATIEPRGPPPPRPKGAGVEVTLDKPPPPLRGRVGVGGGSGESRRAVAFILVIAALLRLGPLLAPPSLSTDIYRYIWDGRVQGAGSNP